MSMPAQFNDKQKLECVEREIAMRKQVYWSRVKQGLMARSLAEREIATMQAIAEDYRRRIQPDLIDQIV